MAVLRRLRDTRARASATTIFAYAVALTLAVVGGFAAPRADATNPACGSVGFTVTPLHGTRFYVDSSSSPVLDSGYTGVTLTPSAAKTNVWVKLSTFAGGALSLNANQPAAFPLGNLSGGSTTPAYFFLTASPVADNATAQTFSVDVYQGDPSHGGSLLCSYGDGYSSGVYDTIQASANKLQDVTGDGVVSTVSTSSPVIGGAITLTVEGTTGTLGSGPDATPFIYETPTSLGNWPAGSFRLTGTTLTLSPGASQTVYTNQLQVANAAWGAAQNYIAQYTFQITGTTASATTPYPIQEISSGTQVKHTNTSSLASIPAIQPASNTMTLSQTASTASLPSSGGTVTYTVKLHSTSSTSTSVDEVIDTLPAGSTYTTGTAKLDGVSIADPTSSSGTLVFPGPFALSSAADRTLTFDVTLPATAGTYTNSVVGYVASTQIDTTTVTSDSAPATASTSVAAAAQTITFAQPADTRVDQGPVSLIASASSGLSVAFGSSTSGVCTVSGSSVTLVAVGTCTITASQAGNAQYAAAAPVSRSFQVTAAPLAQTITFAQPADTRVDQGPVSLTASASSGLSVAFATSTGGVCTVSGSSVTLVAVGTCTITASQGGDASYAAASPVSRSFQVTAAPVAQTISFAQPVDTRLDQGPVSLSASASSGLAVSLASSTTSVCTVSGSSVTLLAVGTCTITASQAGDATYAAAVSVSRSFQVTAAPGPQTITFAQPADTRVDQGPVSLSASASSGLPVSVASSTTNVCTVSGSSVTLVAVGTCTIVASQAGNATYAAAADVTRSFQVTGAPSAQSITFPQPSDTRVDQGPVSLGASASSGLAVTYASSTTGVCTVSGSSVTLVTSGTCTIVASQAGDAATLAAADVTRSFQVTSLPAAPAAQTITFPQPADTQIDQGPVSLGASASSGLAVAYASSTPGVCTVTGSSVSLVATGTCTITASQAGDATYAAAADVTRSFQVTIVPSPLPVPTAQGITFPQPADTQVDQGPVALGATASSGLAVAYASATSVVCSVSGSTVTLLATGTCTIVASQAGDSTYAAAADVTKSFEVTSAAPSPTPPAPTPTAQAITFQQPGDTRVDRGPVALAATASSGLAVAFATSTPGVCTVSGSSVTLVALGTCTITASQGGDSTYAAAGDVSRSFAVTATPVPAPAPAPAAGPHPQAIVFAPIPATGLDAGPIELSAAASSGLGISYESSTPDVCTVSAGGHVTVLATGVCTVVAHQPGNGQWSPAPAALQSFSVVAPPLPAPTTVRTTTVAGKTTQSAVGGIPAGATVALNIPQHLPGVASARVEGTRVIVTPATSFSGIVHVPIVVSVGGRSIETTVPVLVRPAAPTAIAVTPRSRTASTISWKASPSATGYVVRVDGRVICRTTTTTCRVPALVAPESHVVVASTGHAGTRSDDAPAAYAPDKPVLIAIVHFASDSWVLERTARRILDATEAKIARGGFTHAMLTCHTDSAGSLAYNLALSAARCAAVAHYVKRRLGISHVTYNQAAFAFLRPAASNGTPKGMAKNRRVEVYVR